MPHRRARALLPALLVSVLLAVPATASAVTFGADLNRVPNSSATCLDLQLIVIASTCTVESVNASTGESGFPPRGTGRVTQVRVRVGPVTGPMQIVVEEASRQDNPFEAGKPNYACCTAIDASPVFTPAANSITTIPVDFTLTQATTPDENGLYLDQHLALSVLDPNVPIPANIDNNAGVGAWFPAWGSNGESRVGPNGTSLPAQVLFDAEWNAVGGGGGGASQPPPSVQPAPAPVAFPRRVAPVRNGLAVVPLLCNLDRACVGRLLLQSRRPGGAADGASASARKRGAANRRGRPGNRGGGRNRRPRTLTYAVVGFRVPAGKRRAIRAPLRRLAKLILRKRPQLATWVNVRMKGSTVEPTRLLVKRAATRKGSRKPARRRAGPRA